MIPIYDSVVAPINIIFGSLTKDYANRHTQPKYSLEGQDKSRVIYFSIIIHNLQEVTYLSAVYTNRQTLHCLMYKRIFLEKLP
jgi:hypothetical protein